MTANPYAPPQATPTPPRSPLRLFTATAVAIHVFVLPPMGAMLAVANYQRLRDSSGTWKAVALFLLPAVALVGFGVASRSIAQLGLVCAARAGLALVAFRDQKPLVMRHFAAGGKKGRVAIAWLVALPACFLLLALAVVLESPPTP